MAMELNKSPWETKDFVALAKRIHAATVQMSIKGDKKQVTAEDMIAYGKVAEACKIFIKTFKPF